MLADDFCSVPEQAFQGSFVCDYRTVGNHALDWSDSLTRLNDLASSGNSLVDCGNLPIEPFLCRCPFRCHALTLLYGSTLCKHKVKISLGTLSSDGH